jgi:potassium-transporting ATPase KdpC subunit
MSTPLRPAIVSVLLFTLLLGIAYPLAVTGIGQIAFPHQAGGSLLRGPDGIVGSALIGQNFTKPDYLHPRLSAAGQGYDATASGGSNLGPLNPALAKSVAAAAAAIRAENPGVTGPVPGDAVTASGSGLDPDISPAYAFYQAARIARARGVPVTEVDMILRAHITPPFLGFLGQAHVNVLETNLAFDRSLPARTTGSP